MNKGVTSMSDIKRLMKDADGDVAAQKDLLLLANYTHETLQAEFREKLRGNMMLPPDQQQFMFNAVIRAQNKARIEYMGVVTASDYVGFKRCRSPDENDHIDNM